VIFGLVELVLSLDQQPADDVGVDACAGIILADLADQQQVELIERQSAHDLLRSVQQVRLDLE